MNKDALFAAFVRYHLFDVLNVATSIIPDLLGDWRKNGPRDL